MGAKVSKVKKVAQDPIHKELDNVKKLLILMLLKAGTPQGEIAKALNMDQGHLSRIIPARSIKPFSNI